MKSKEHITNQLETQFKKKLILVVTPKVFLGQCYTNVRRLQCIIYFVGGIPT